MINRSMLSIFDDTLIDPEIIPGSERFEINKFKRMYTVFRQDQIGSTLVKVGGKFQLPWNSIYHTLDNFDKDSYLDVPRVEEDEFILREYSKKYIYHVKAPVSGPCSRDMEDRYIYRPAGLNSILMKFRNTYKNDFRYLNTLDEIPAKKDALPIINHNPLFRVRFRGKLTFYRQTNFILSSVLNTAASIKSNKIQFIHIPLTPSVYTKESLLRSKRTLDLPAIKYPYSRHWIFFMHLLNFLDVKCDTSLLEQLDSNTIEKINFILTVPNQDGELRAIIYNLATLKEFNAGNKRYLRIVNHLNCLAASGILTESELSKEYQVEVVDSNKIEDTSVSTDTNETSVEDGKVDISTKTNTRKIDISQVTTKDVDRSNELKSKTDPKKNPEIVSQVSRAHVLPSIIRTVTPVITDTEEVEVSKAVSTNSITVPTKIDNTKTKTLEEPKTVSSILDTRTKEWIDSQDRSPKEKERMRIISEKYKKLTLDGVPLEQLIDAPLSDNTEYVTPEVDIPDQSMRVSRAIKFNENYLKNTNKRHFAQILTSFHAQGLVLVDLKEKDTSTPFDRTKEYSATYFNLETNSQSTLKINVPVPDNEGKYLLGGIPLFIKKQLVNVPICKINETTVSISSGFNKTQVIRNTNSRSNFLGYFRKLVAEGELQGVLTSSSGMESINDKLSYEYTEISKRYSKIEIQGNDVNATLVFGSDNERNEYGIYTGKIGTTKIFIDLNNTLHYLKDGKEIMDYPSSYIGLIVSSLINVSKIKPLEEWVDVKLLDANFPLIFLLGYRFGLKNILDYLEVDYTLLDKKKNVLDTDTTISILDKIPSLIAIKELGLSEDDYVIVGSSSLVAYGYPEISNDLDLIISVDKAKELHDKGQITPYPNEEGRYTANIDDNVIDINTLTFDRKREALPNYLKASQLIEDYRFLTFEGCIAFYSTLVKKYNLPKHVEKLNWLKTNKNPKKVKHDKSPTDIYIPFKDVILSLDRYPLTNSLIVSGISRFNTSDHFFNEFDSKDVYYSLLVDKGYGMNYIKGIDAFFDLFLNDQMTIDTLLRMGEPTNMRDLLIRATVMLTTTYHEVAASMSNHRLRGVEQVNTIIYNEISRQFANYRARAVKGSKFTINPEAIYQRILQNETLSPVEETNPLHAIKENLAITYSGIGGRSNESFVVRDRKYPEDAIGILSESTVDSGKVGINATLSVNPKVVNSVGALDTSKDIFSTDNASEVLSIVGAVMPGALGDDAKRLNMVTIQQAHVIGTYEKDVCRVRTGMEKVIPFMTSKTFSGVAKEDGVVTKIDQAAGIISVKYKDGNTELFQISDKYSDVSGNTVVNKTTPNVKEGDRVSKGDIICFNDKFFKKDPITNELSYVHGVNTTVAFFECEGTQEDSSRVSRRLAHKLTSDAVHVRGVKIRCTDTIHQIVEIGDHVFNTDTIMTFEDSSMLSSFGDADDDTTRLLSKVNRRIPTAKHTGNIARIEVYYSCELEDMTPSVRKLVTKYTNIANNKSKLAKGTLDEGCYPVVEKIKPGTKYRGYFFGDDSVLFFFTITEPETYGVGDKLILGLQLKSTTMSVYDTPITTLSGKPVEMIFSAAKAYGRVVTSAFLIGGASMVLEELENQALDMYFD